MKRILSLMMVALLIPAAMVAAQEADEAMGPSDSDFESLEEMVEEALSVQVGGEFGWGFNYNQGEDIFVQTVDTAEIFVEGDLNEMVSFDLDLNFTEVVGGAAGFIAADTDDDGDIDEDDDAFQLGSAEVDDLQVNLDLGSLFDSESLGFSLNWMNGYTDPGAAIPSDVTRYEFEINAVDNGEFELDEDWVSEITTEILGIVTFQLAWNWDVGADADGGERDDDADGLDDGSSDDVIDVVTGIAVELPGIVGTIAYSTNKVSGGALGFGVGADVAELAGLSAMGLGLDFAANLGLNLAEGEDYGDAGLGEDDIDALGPEAVRWSVGVGADYAVSESTTVDFGVSYIGQVEDDEIGLEGLTVIGVDAGVALAGGLVEVYGGVALDFTDYEALNDPADPASARENVDGLSSGEVGAIFAFGDFSISTGYYFVGDTVGFDGSIESFVGGADATDKDNGDPVGHAFLNFGIEF